MRLFVVLLEEGQSVKKAEWIEVGGKEKEKIEDMLKEADWQLGRTSKETTSEDSG